MSSVCLVSDRDHGDLQMLQDYVRMMWMMLQCEKPDDFVVATNKSLDLRSLFGTPVVGCF